MTKGQRVTLRDKYELANQDDKPNYIGTFRKMCSDGYGIVDWDAGHSTEEWVGFDPEDCMLLPADGSAPTVALSRSMPVSDDFDGHDGIWS